jgi:hypothetical protein
VRWLLAVSALLAVQSARGQVIGVNIAGSINDVGFIPPDTNGAAGVDYIVEAINGRVAYYRKSDGVRTTSQSLTTFWTSRGLSVTSNTFDPRVIYDPSSRRFFISALDGTSSSANNSLFLAASSMVDPTATWTVQKMAVSSSYFADFDMLGVNGNTVTVSMNNFTPSGGGTTVSLVSIPKSSVIAGNATNALINNNVDPNSVGYSAHPVRDYTGNTSTTHLVSMFNNSTVAVTPITTSGTTPTLGTRTLSSVSSVTTPGTARQPDTVTPGLDAGDERFSGTPIRQGNFIWCVNSTVVSGTNNVAINYYRINATTRGVIESGTISDPNFDFIFPSIAVNPNGNIVIGFTRTGPSASSGYPAAAVITGSFSGSTTTIAPVASVLVTRAGTASYLQTFGGSENRWGDYSSTDIDPADPQIFWAHQEYASNSTTWGVQHTELIIPLSGEARWSNAASGNFTDATNFLSGSAPAATDRFILSRATTPGRGYTVTFTGATTVGGLSSRQGNVVLNLGANTLNIGNSGAGNLVVGEFGGAPNLTVTGTGSVLSATANLAPSNTSSGRLVLAGGTWTNSGSVYVGGSVSGAGGTGGYSGTGGTAAITGSLVIYPLGSVALASPHQTSVSTVSFQGGTATVTGTSLAARLITLPSGLLSIPSAATLSSTSVSLTGGTLAATATLSLTNSSTLTQTGGLLTGAISLSASRLALTAGSNALTGLTVTAAGLVTASLASVILPNTTVSGSGSLINFASTVATLPSGTGLLLSNAGTFSGTSLTMTGSLASVSGGTLSLTGSLVLNPAASFTQGSGSVSVQTLAVAGGTFTYNGGLLSFGSPLVVSAGGLFASTPGTSRTLPNTTVTGTGSVLNFAGSNLTVASSGSLTLSAGGRASASTFTLGTSASVVNTGGTLAATTSLTIPATATITQSGGTVSSPATANSGLVSINGGTASLGVVTGAGTLAASGVVNVTATSINQALLSATSGATVTLTGSALSVVSSVSIAAGGFIDLGTGTLLLRPAPADATGLRALVASWWNNGSRNGPGLGTSSTNTFSTLAVFNNNYTGTAYYPTLGAVSLTAADILVRYTYLGDINLDGSVNGLDFKLFSEYSLVGAPSGITGWAAGDFNYDGQVNASDLQLLIASENAGLPSLGAPSDVDALTVTIPEPMGLGWLVFPVAVSTRRRRR